jgi:fructosamine-3-kinase
LSPLSRLLARRLDAEVLSLTPLGGGDINDAHQLRLGDGRVLFVKSNPRFERWAFVAEAKGLAWLAQARCLRVPDVVAVSEEQDRPAFLVLEYLPPGRPAPDHDEQLGRGLAGVHRAGAASFGLDHSNLIGSLPQENAPRPAWSEFYWEQRLAPQLCRAVDAGKIPRRIQTQFEKLHVALDQRLGPTESPSRLHGDLWSGNVHVTADGAPCLIDPACYGGHREVDLAMMRLFGGFRARVFESYHEAFPLAPGASERVPLYQLYPLLVHVNLFGGGYVSSLETRLAQLL